ncbi:MAG: CocE/NonD family hydrolase [Planctomycetota bacterium]
MHRLLLISVAAILFIGIHACRAYEPVEEFPHYSAAVDDRTGRQWVNPLFPTAGTAYRAHEKKGIEPDPKDKASLSTNQPQARSYIPETFPLAWIPSLDGTYRFAPDVSIPTRDGTRLKTDFYLPLQDGRYPVILERTPFNRKAVAFAEQRGPAFARAGFAYAIQTVRGLADSEGVFTPFKNEREDGKDTCAWISAQPWFSGALGTIGTGYGAYASLLAGTGPSAPRSMIVENCSSNLFLNGGYYLNGIPMIASLYAEIVWRFSDIPSLMESLRWEDALFHLPLREMDDILGQPLPFWDECLLHPSYDHFWDSLSLNELLPKLKASVLHIGGWHSLQDLGGSITNYQALVALNSSQANPSTQALLVGPWSKGINSETSLGFYDFTDAGKINKTALLLDWFSKTLLNAAGGNGSLPSPVRFFLLGANEWIDARSWPLPDINMEPLFLHSRGRAHLSWDEGRLSSEEPYGFEEIDSFNNDPADPVLSELELGTDDQRPVERRNDVLAYSTPPLEWDLTVIGSPQAVLYINTTAPDTDIVVLMTDVDEYGYSRPVAFGVLRTRFRNSYQSPSPISQTEIAEYVIDLTPMANRFLKGHQIRLNIMGSYFPFLTRNLNTGSAMGQETEIRQASIFLLHDLDYPSRLVLPLAP